MLSDLMRTAIMVAIKCEIVERKRDGINVSFIVNILIY